MGRVDGNEQSRRDNRYNTNCSEALGSRAQTMVWLGLIFAIFSFLNQCRAHGQQVDRDDVIAAAERATHFLTSELSTEGGYLWRYLASDVSIREGEGVVKTETVWVQPPGTPSVGEAFVRLYRATDSQVFLNAALEAGKALQQGQMLSGGWQASVEFEPERRAKWAYRTHLKQPRRAKDQSSLDDDKSQSAIRFIIQLDQALTFENDEIHEMATFALSGLLEHGQFSNGGFPQVWSSDPAWSAVGNEQGVRQASYPDSWSWEYEGHKEYWRRFTLNDNLGPDVLKTLFMAEEIYGGGQYRQAALRHADFLLLAQMPDPQPAWAQQYSFAMQPIWARKFEPPAVTGGESQGVIETLMWVYEQTGDNKYLRPIPRAIKYLESSLLSDGRLARFYELQTNKPLYFSKDYQLTYDDSDVPTHYSFKVSSRLERLKKRYKSLINSTHSKPKSMLGSGAASQIAVREVLNSQAASGAWISNGGMRYHKRDGNVIDMRHTVRCLNTLADYLQQDGKR